MEASWMAQKVHVKKDDTVHVLSGEDVGKTGKVLAVHPKTGRVVVDGINIQKKHARPTRQNPQGGVIEQPGPIHASKVMVVCPSCNKPTRVSHSRAAGQEAARVCKHCNKSID